MSCSGYFDTLLSQANEEAFKKERVRLEKMRDKLRWRVQNLRVQGDFHKVNMVEKIMERMKQILEA